MSAEALPKKRRIRAGHRSSATRLLTRIDAALAATPTDSDQLSQLKFCLKEKLETLKLLDAEIVELTPEEELVEEIEQTDEYKENVYCALTRIDKALRVSSTTATAVDPPPPPATTRHTSPPAHKVRLPKLTLPHFSGDAMKWPTFWDSYESAVHNSPDLSDVDKFNYLRSLLEWTAYEAIAGLTLSTANYREAIDILKKRYGVIPCQINNFSA